MDNILRRPMFRGGRVENRGGGITSLLGYANGGQVTPKRGLVDMPGGYAGVTPAVTGTNILEKNLSNQGFGQSPLYKLGKTIDEYTTKPLGNLSATIGNYFSGLAGYPELFPYREPSPSNIFVPSSIEETPEKTLEEKLAKQLEEKNEANVADKINKITTDTTTIEVPEKSNRDVMNEYMDMFKSVLGSDQDELTRQKYLELAKFGTNLLAQGGGKRSTLEKIGAAGTQSIEGLSKIAAQERASDKQIKLAGLQAALKEMDPGTVGKAVNDLKKLVPREQGESIKDYNQRITSMAIETGTGAATRAKVESDKFDRLSNNLVTSEIVRDEISGDRAAETIKRYKISLNDLGQDATTAKQDKKYYIKKDGTIYRYDAKKNSGILPGEPGF
jgi:hypothetical protein